MKIKKSKVKATKTKKGGIKIQSGVRAGAGDGLAFNHNQTRAR